MARPRAAGSAEESETRAYCNAILESNGFSTTEEPFVYSSAVGRLAVPVAGALSFVALAAASAALLAGWNARAVGAMLLIFLLFLSTLGRWLSRTGVLEFRAARRNGVNLVGVRGEPGLWLMAHLDTKSQPIPSLLRAASLVAMATALLLVALGALLGWSGNAPAGVAGVGAVAAILVSLSTVGNESPGGADNGSGVAVLLTAIEQLPRSTPLGVVFTSAEELGLAGARAWARTQRPLTAVNIDTVDDTGVIRCMVHGRQSRYLAGEIASYARATGRSLVVSPLIPGILTDGVALGDAGWSAVTLSRGGLSTLARIHRPSDTVHSMTGRGARELAQLLSEWISDRESKNQ